MRKLRAVAGVLGLALASGMAAAAQAHKAKAAKSGPIVHSVYFWLKDTATKQDVETLIRDCKEMLGPLPCVQRLDVGTPLGKGRGAVDSSYQIGLVVYFADQAAYDAYVPHPKHQALVKKHKALWKKVVIYDFVKR